MLVKAIRRGYIDGVTYEPGDQFDCPIEQLALVSGAPIHQRPHPDPGWMEALEPLGAEDLSLIAAAAPKTGHGDGLWGVGEHAHNDKLKRPGMFTL